MKQERTQHKPGLSAPTDRSAANPANHGGSVSGATSDVNEPPWDCTDIDEAVQSLITSINNQSLVFFCGAGLSMGPPSSLPSAARLVEDLEQEYQALHGRSLVGAVGNNIEQVAEWALDNPPEFQDFFLPIINSDDFFQPSNPGHETVADFLIAEIAEAAVSTNVDYLIENAARKLGRARFKGIVRREHIGSQQDHAPLLKIHGCFDEEQQYTVWCERQLASSPFAERIAAFQDWMRSYLPQKDLLIIGYWTDWPYLNEVLQDSIRDLNPRSVILVDPSEPSDLKAKAQQLATWVTEDQGISFSHVMADGNAFLTTLRREFSKSFFRRMIQQAIQHNGPSNYYGFGTSAPPTIPPVDEMDMPDLYNLRRDFQGVPNTRPVTDREPSGSHYERVGALHQILMEQSAAMNGRIYTLNGDAFRLVNSRNRLVDVVKQEFIDAGDTTRAVKAHVCVGSRNSVPGKPNVVRDPDDDDVVRSGQTQPWWTDDDVVKYLNQQSTNPAP